MDERAQLIQQLNEAREKMRALVADIDPQMEIYPTWRLKELLAHIAGWDDATIAALRSHARGDVPDTPARRGIDYYNAETVTTRSPLSLDHVKKEWEVTRQGLKSAIEAMPLDRLARPLVFPWGETGTVAQIVAIMAHHETEHVEEIRGLMVRAELSGT